MKIDRLAYMYGIDYNEYGCYDKLRDKLQSLRNKTYFAYREGYVLTETENCKIKEPAIYKFDEYFKRVEGTGHSTLGGRTYDYEYEIFLSKESALEYANNKLIEFLEQKKINDKKQEELDLKKLHYLAKKFDYILIKKDL